MADLKSITIDLCVAQLYRVQAELYAILQRCSARLAQISSDHLRSLNSRHVAIAVSDHNQF